MSKDFTIEVVVDEKTGDQVATVHMNKPPTKKKTTKKETPEVQQ